MEIDPIGKFHALLNPQYRDSAESRKALFLSHIRFSLANSNHPALVFSSTRVDLNQLLGQGDGVHVRVCPVFPTRNGNSVDTLYVQVVNDEEIFSTASASVAWVSVFSFSYGLFSEPSLRRASYNLTPELGLASVNSFNKLIEQVARIFDDPSEYDLLNEN